MCGAHTLESWYNSPGETRVKRLLKSRAVALSAGNVNATARKGRPRTQKGRPTNTTGPSSTPGLLHLLLLLVYGPGGTKLCAYAYIFISIHRVVAAQQPKKATGHPLERRARIRLTANGSLRLGGGGRQVLCARVCTTGRIQRARLFPFDLRIQV